MAPPTTNGRSSNDWGREWSLRALRGEITTPQAYSMVACSRELLEQGRLDEESTAALELGDKARPDDTRRFVPLDRSWEWDGNADPATEAAFEALTKREDFAAGYQPTDDGLWDSYDHEPLQVFIDWPEFWADDGPEDEWLYNQVFALGRGHAVYASHKQGKSLFVLWCAAQLATTRTDVNVIYLDYEMTRADVRERLEDMGYGPGTDLTRLYYALLPSIPPLDTMEGMNALMELVRHVEDPEQHLFVVIDTTARAAHGDENSADTYRDFYRWTGTALKRRGITWVRLDHAGKDPLKGQRGSSSKGDDVDVVWRLQQADNGIVLYRDVARMSWVDEKLTYAIKDDPLRYERTGELWPARVSEIAGLLDELGAPMDVTKRKACELVREAGTTGSNDLIWKAAQFRRQRVQILDEKWADPDLAHSPDHQTGPKTSPTENNPLTRVAHPLAHVGPGAAVVGQVSVSIDTDQAPPDQKTCRCGQPATDISGLCPACIANPGTLPPIDPNDRF